MQHSVWIIGALICLWGVAVLIRPDWMKRVVDFLAKSRRFVIAAAAKIVFGVVLLVFARGCRIPWVIMLIGVLFAGGSVVALMIDPEKIRTMVGWWQKQALWIYRVWGVVAVLFGGLVIFAGLPQ